MKKQHYLLPLTLRNLQTFAEGGEGDTNPATVDHSHNQEGTNASSSPASDFKAPESQSELDSLINKAVQTALGNQKKGEEERVHQAVAEALKKEKDYANLSAQERAKKEFEDRQSEFEKERAAFEYEKLVVQVEKDLVAKGLPSSFAETFAMSGDAETALQAVTEFETAFNKAVADGVKASLRQSAPTANGRSFSQADNYGAKLAQKGAKSTGKII